MLNIDCLKANKTQFWQFGAIFEVDLRAPSRVHTSIFIDQLAGFFSFESGYNMIYAHCAFYHVGAPKRTTFTILCRSRCLP